MDNKDLDSLNSEQQESVNEYGLTKDSAVVVEKQDRTVFLNDNETIVIGKNPALDIAPKDRPRKAYAGMWGTAEIVTVGLALFAVLAAGLLYVLVVVPSNRELERNRAERGRLETELVSTRAKYGDITSTEAQVAKLLTSVSDFESHYLPVAATGRTALYQRLNGLIAGYGLVNTTGPDYAPLEIADQGNGSQSDDERGRAKYRSLFPGVYVTTTVEGSYQNLRRFMREIETGREFVVISAVELEPSDTEQQEGSENAPTQASVSAPAVQYDPRGFPVTNPRGGIPTSPRMQVQPQAPGPKGKTHGSTVRLRLEMAAYFRRPSMMETDPNAGTEN